MARSNIWWADTHFDTTTDTTTLLDPTTHKSTEANIPDASPLSILVEGVFTAEGKESRGKKNDLVIASVHKIGSKQPVTKLHYHKADTDAFELVNALYYPSIWTTKDFQAESHRELLLHMKVYDEDGLNDSEKAKVNGLLSTLFAAGALAFPVLAPIAGLAKGVSTAVVDLVDELDKHDKLLDQRVKLSANREPHTGYNILQPGFFVIFEEAVDAENLALDSRLALQASLPQGGTEPYTGCTYVVLRVEKEYKFADDDLIIDEKAATLLSEIVKGQNSEVGGGGAALGFLRDTLRTYYDFQRLKRYAALTNKPEGELTDEENALIQELRTDPRLSDFTNLGG